MGLGICERLLLSHQGTVNVVSKWAWVSVNVFPLSHRDHVANGPGYLLNMSR